MKKHEQKCAVSKNDKISKQILRDENAQYTGFD
jgi:hypothetical protein